MPPIDLSSRRTFAVRDMPGAGVPDRLGEVPVVGDGQQRAPVRAATPPRPRPGRRSRGSSSARRAAAPAPGCSPSPPAAAGAAPPPTGCAAAASHWSGPNWCAGQQPSPRRRRTPAPATRKNSITVTSVRSPSAVCGSTATSAPRPARRSARSRVVLPGTVTAGDQDPVAAAHVQVDAVEQRPPPAAPRSDRATRRAPPRPVAGVVAGNASVSGGRVRGSRDPPHRLHLPAQPPLADLGLLRATFFAIRRRCGASTPDRTVGLHAHGLPLGRARCPASQRIRSFSCASKSSSSRCQRRVFSARYAV